MITCHFEDGGTGKLRHVTVGAIVLNNKHDQILMVKRASHLSEPNKFDTPGGYLDRDENTQAGALREILEETGYKAKILNLLKITDGPNRKGEDRQNVEFYYLAEATEQVKDSDHETSSIHWFALNELPSEKDVAFDHYENIELYLKYREKPFELPFFKSN